MTKLSQNQEGALAALKKVTTDAGVEVASKGVWKGACDAGVSVNTAAMLKTGSVVAVKAAVSTNGKVTELFRPA